MYEGNSFLGGPDFSSLAETPPPPPEKTPEKLELDDDDDAEEYPKPKTLMDYLKDEPEKTEKKEDAKKVEEEAEKEKDESAEEEEETEPEEIDDDAEADPGAPEMTGEEEQLAATEILETRAEDVKEEKEKAQTKEEKAEAETAEDFIENAKDGLKDGKSVDEALEAAQQKTLEAAGIEAADEPSEPEQPPQTTEIPPEIPEVPTAEEDPSAIPIPPVPPITPPTPPTPPGGGGTGLPPFGPGRPFGPGGPGGGGPGGGGGNVLPPTPNVLPTAPAEDDTSTRRVNTRGAVLAGGLVGYLLGRRRGRIRTEKKLLPIQHKLEKEVADLRGKIAWREASIRALARDHAAKTPEAGDEIVERLKTHHERKAGDTERNAEKLHTAHPERLGKFAVDTEKASQSEAYRTPERPKPVDVMTLPELLVIGERIKIEESTVKRLFETNRLNDEGLRRVIRAYLRGERYERVITDNLLTPEKYPYPETLQRNAVEADPLHGAGVEQSTQTQSNPSALGMINPAAHATSPPAYDQTELPAHKKAPPTGAIVVGTIIAVLILVFMLTR